MQSLPAPVEPVAELVRDRGAEIEAAQAARAAARKAAMDDLASKLEAGDQLTQALRRRAAASEPEASAAPREEARAAQPVPPVAQPAPTALPRTNSVPGGAVAAARARLAELAAASPSKPSAGGPL
jgi:hypothetical protein